MMASTSSNNEVRTMVLVGRTGNGKSATGNSILGKKVFKSRASSSGVTSTCELRSIVRSNGQIINVIDTPGLFAGSEFVGKEIVKCMDMAKDGIHAILVVLSVKTRFSLEEKAALHTLQTLFGNKITDYMIVVFTGGDELEENDETLEDYLGRECPESLKEVLALCGYRCVLFDNKTKDERKRFGQVQQLLLLVNMVISQNGGRPYTNELFVELKEGAIKLHNQLREVDFEVYPKAKILEFKKEMQQSYDDKLKRITETVESKFKEGIANLSQQLAEEKDARLKVEKKAKSTKIKLGNEIEKLRQDLEDVNSNRVALRPTIPCPIL